MKFYKTVIVLSLLFVSSIQANAQIEDEIKSYVDSTEILFNNGRKLLLQKIQSKDYAKAAEVYNFLKDKAAIKNCAAFNYTEDLYISALVSDWASFFNKVENYSSSSEVVCYPKSFELLGLLYEELSQKTDLLLKNAEKEQLSNEDRDLLEIYFYLMKVGDRDDTYDKMVNTFHKKYPKTRFASFFKYYLPTPSVSSAISYSFGANSLFPTGNLGKNFDSQIGFYMSMDFNVRRAYFSMFVDISSLKLLNSFSSGNYTFNANDRFSNLNVGFIGGYYVLRTKSLHVVPYFNLGGGTLQSNLYEDDDDDDKEFKIYDSFIYGVGLHNEFKIFQYKTRSANNSNVAGYFSLKLDAGYNWIAKYNYRPFEGNLASVRLAIVWGIGTF